MVTSVAYYTILGKPVVFYLGILTLLSFSFTAYIGYSNMKGKHRIPMRYHFRLAIISFALAIIHGFLAASTYLGI